MLMKLYLVYLFLILFVGDNVVSRMGFVYNQYLMVIVVIAFPFVLKKYKEIVKTKPLFYLLFYLSAYFCIRLLFVGGEGAKWGPILLLGAPLLYSVFPFYSHLNRIFYKKVFFLLIAFYLTEVIIAIFEKLYGSAIFGWSNNDSILLELGSGTDFRSVALLGHPLQNALIVSIIMSFVLVSPLKEKYRYLLWMLGFMSILCFNTRAALVGNILIFLFYYAYNIRNKNRRKLLSHIFIGMCCMFVGIFFMLFTDWGGRLVEMGLFDENSAQVRVDVWSIFDYFPIENFLWGIDSSAKNLILYKTGLYATENFWIDWLLSYGLIFLIPFLILYFYWIKYLYRGYSRISVAITLSTFLLLASTNNSLSVTFIPVFIFLFCTRIFNPQIFRNYVSAKYIE